MHCFDWIIATKNKNAKYATTNGKHKIIMKGKNNDPILFSYGGVVETSPSWLLFFLQRFQIGGLMQQVRFRKMLVDWALVIQGHPQPIVLRAGAASRPLVVSEVHHDAASDQNDNTNQNVIEHFYSPSLFKYFNCY